MSRYQDQRAIFARAAAVLLAFVIVSVASAAVLAPETPKKLTDTEIAAIGKPAADGLIYSGDVIYRPARLKSIGLQLKRWPGGKLIYAFDEDITEDVRKTAFRSACDSWTAGTSVECVERTSEADYVLVSTHDGEGCGGSEGVSCSEVGQIGGAQKLEVYETHWLSAYLLQHEIGHALGLLHEHQRRDREPYVNVVTANIEEGQEAQFAIRGDGATLSFYDYDSIMHYDNCAFSRNSSCTTSTPKHQTLRPQSCYRTVVGGTSITQMDRDGLRRLYSYFVFELFPMTASSSCGTQKFSKKEKEAACGANCVVVNRTFSNRNRWSDSACGLYPNVNAVALCATRYNKDFVKQWEDSDRDWGCAPQKRYEIWVECGCESFAIKNMCTDYVTWPDRARIQKLTQSRDQIGKTIGELGLKFDDLLKANRVSAAAATRIGPLLIENYNTRDFVRNLRRFAREVDIATRNKTGALTVEELVAAAKTSGLSVGTIDKAKIEGFGGPPLFTEFVEGEESGEIAR